MSSRDVKTIAGEVVHAFTPEPRDMAVLPAEAFGDLAFHAAMARRALERLSTGKLRPGDRKLGAMYAERLHHALVAAHDVLETHTVGGDDD